MRDGLHTVHDRVPNFCCCDRDEVWNRYSLLIAGPSLLVIRKQLPTLMPFSCSFALVGAGHGGESGLRVGFLREILRAGLSL
jgi:hypothetical protein